MYKMSYAEVMELDAREARARERIAFDHAIELMKRAEAAAGDRATETAEAVQYLQKLWMFFIENLTSPDNELGGSLKNDLISIGLWAIAELDRVLADNSKSLSPLIDVNAAIRDGLA